MTEQAWEGRVVIRAARLDGGAVRVAVAVEGRPGEAWADCGAVTVAGPDEIGVLDGVEIVARPSWPAGAEPTLRVAVGKDRLDAGVTGSSAPSAEGGAT